MQDHTSTPPQPAATSEPGRIASSYLFSGPLLYVSVTFILNLREVAIPIEVLPYDREVFPLATLVLPSVLGFLGALLVHRRGLERRIMMSILCGTLLSVAAILARDAYLSGTLGHHLSWMPLVLLPLMCGALCDWLESGRPWKRAGPMTKVVVTTACAILASIPSLMLSREMNKLYCEWDPRYRLHGFHSCDVASEEGGRNI